MCGEKGGTLCGNFDATGSPPRMRGKAVLILDDVPGVGITPAYAGKRARAMSASLPCRDHPRVCGEKPVFPSGAASTVGSPLRVRGKVMSQPDGANYVGITPAYAGKSSRNETCWHRPWDHPCVCGEKTKPVPAGGILMGSPPRMRGKDALPRPLPQKQGITPACAGKSP